MIRRLFRRALRIGLVVGAILLLIQIFLRNPAPKESESGRPSGPATPPRPRQPEGAATLRDSGGNAVASPTTSTAAPPAPAPAPPPPPPPPPTATEAPAATEPGQAPAPAAATDEPGATTALVEPEDGACPVTHPVKVKLASGIFHVPGGLAYERTAPDRCYRDAEAAEADGFRPSKR